MPRIRLFMDVIHDADVEDLMKMTAESPVMIMQTRDGNHRMYTGIFVGANIVEGTEK